MKNIMIDASVLQTKFDELNVSATKEIALVKLGLLELKNCSVKQNYDKMIYYNMCLELFMNLSAN